jgi:release factor glutamine methyltransferase
MNVNQALAFAKQAIIQQAAQLNSLDEPIQSAQLAQSAHVDAEYLLTYLLHKNTTWLKTWPEYELSHAQKSSFKALLERRVQGEPIAYITGSKGFWDLELNTNNSTLIPRSETELLVETALEFLTTLGHNKSQPIKILDLGTGTGAVALALASEQPDAQVFALDFNQNAVDLARQNAEKNKIENVTIFQSDWFNQVEANCFDLIVSNPPYIEPNDPHLNQGDLIFEPNSALVAEDQGLADIKLIMQQAKPYLAPNAALMFEHGYQQAEAVSQWFTRYGYTEPQTIKDLAGQDRVTLAIWPKIDQL